MTFNCKECESDVDTSAFMKNLGEILGCERLCFDCYIWLPIVRKHNDSRRVVVNHIAYWLGNGNKDTPKCLLGYGGRKFRVRFNDGRTVETSDLNCTGFMPKRFWDDMPDNAEFLSVEK